MGRNKKTKWSGEVMGRAEVCLPVKDSKTTGLSEVFYWHPCSFLKSSSP